MLKKFIDASIKNFVLKIISMNIPKSSNFSVNCWKNQNNLNKSIRIENSPIESDHNLILAGADAAAAAEGKK